MVVSAVPVVVSAVPVVVSVDLLGRSAGLMVVGVDPVVGTADREVMSAVEMEGWRG